MKKRLEVSLIENGAKVQLRGVDETRNSYHLFKRVKVFETIPGETLSTSEKVFPAPQGPTEQPYKFALPAAEARTEAFQVDLQFMGHYQENNLRLKVNMQQLA